MLSKFESIVSKFYVATLSRSRQTFAMQDLIISQHCCPDVWGKDGTEQDVSGPFGVWDTVSLQLYLD